MFIPDHHRAIAKWIRETQAGTSRFFEIWHIACSIGKAMLKLSKENGCHKIKDWMKGGRNHLYWCATSTKQGFESLILAQWRSFFISHVANKHDDHPDSLSTKCAHGVLEPRRWIKIVFYV